MKRSLTYLLVLMLVVACKPTVPSEYIQPGDMEDILYDYHLALAMSRQKGSGDLDFNRSLYFQSVLKKHGVTEAEFDSSLIYYYSHAYRLKDIYSEVNQRLNDEATSLGVAVGDINRYSQYSTTGDTANIWNQQSDLLLIPRATMNRYDFTVKVDSTFMKGDSFMFQFMSEYIWQNGSKDLTVCIVCKYDGDSIIQTSNHISVSGTAQVRVPANREKKLKDMRGFIYLSDGGDDSNTQKMLFISQIQLIRFHDKTIANEEEITNDESNTEAPAKDSIQRGDDSRRPEPDTLRRRVSGGQHGLRPIPIDTRNGVHRMDAGPTRN
ncbi:MAG: DUF4296 domain-containing protein [Prevotella sp.]|nr:DUF4296 domain-containing protein [Prevotella sp.]